MKDLEKRKQVYGILENAMNQTRDIDGVNLVIPKDLRKDLIIVPVETKTLMDYTSITT